MADSVPVRTGHLRSAAAKLRLALPDGVFTPQLWDGAGTLLEKRQAEVAFDFALVANGVWHSLVILDTNGDEGYSVWMRAQKLLDI